MSEHDEKIADLYLGGEEIESDLIESAIRDSIKTQKSVALFCGSALKNKGIQPLLDGIIKYLPSPMDAVP